MYLPKSRIHSAGVRPGCRSTFGLAKVDKTIDALPDHIRLDGRKTREGAPTRFAQTRPAKWLERPPWGPGGRRRSTTFGEIIRPKYLLQGFKLGLTISQLASYSLFDFLNLCRKKSEPQSNLANLFTPVLLVTSFSHRKFHQIR